MKDVHLTNTKVPLKPSSRTVSRTGAVGTGLCSVPLTFFIPSQCSFINCHCVDHPIRRFSAAPLLRQMRLRYLDHPAVHVEQSLDLDHSQQVVKGDNAYHSRSLQGHRLYLKPYSPMRKIAPYADQCNSSLPYKITGLFSTCHASQWSSFCFDVDARPCSFLFRAIHCGETASKRTKSVCHCPVLVGP